LTSSHLNHNKLWLADIFWDTGAIQFGSFTLGKTVRNSPIYIDAKLLISKPTALQLSAKIISDEIKTSQTKRKRQIQKFNAIAGVPIGGLHIATALSLEINVPLLYVRPTIADVSENASYIEGRYIPGQTAVLVDDLATGGSSLIGTADRLRDAGILVNDAIVLIDREQGAKYKLNKIGIKLHSILTLDIIIKYLHANKKINDEDFHKTQDYLNREKMETD